MLGFDESSSGELTFLQLQQQGIANMGSLALGISILLLIFM